MEGVLHWLGKGGDRDVYIGFGGRGREREGGAWWAELELKRLEVLSARGAEWMGKPCWRQHDLLFLRSGCNRSWTSATTTSGRKEMRKQRGGEATWRWRQGRPFSAWAAERSSAPYCVSMSPHSGLPFFGLVRPRGDVSMILSLFFIRGTNCKELIIFIHYIRSVVRK
jgi:hypothetical protein